jgi:hypothetical protein
VRKNRVAKDEDTTAALAIAVVAIEEDVYPSDPRNGFSDIAD